MLQYQHTTLRVLTPFVAQAGSGALPHLQTEGEPVEFFLGPDWQVKHSKPYLVSRYCGVVKMFDGQGKMVRVYCTPRGRSGYAVLGNGCWRWSCQLGGKEEEAREYSWMKGKWTWRWLDGRQGETENVKRVAGRKMTRPSNLLCCFRLTAKEKEVI